MADAAARSFTKKGASTRDRIVDGARTMLVERGYDGLVLRELADSLGITIGNLQYYFSTREALALHVLEDEASRDARLVDEERARSSPIETFRTAVRYMITRYRGDSGALLLMLTALAQHHDSFSQLYEDSYAGFYPGFESLLAELRPGLSADEVALRARVINSLVEGSSFQTHLDDLDAFFDRIVAESESIALARGTRSGSGEELGDR
ncbi:MAG: TetR/AcrR family transcriptional regulator [Actinomycetota bacterium]